MISRRVVETARFLRMPMSARLLYYDLNIRADDDGIVEAFPVIQQSGCTEDDLRVLCAREFVKVLNEDLVSYILDWRENNQIRGDRKTDSIYKDLLLQVLPEADVQKGYERADLRKKREKKSTVDDQRTTDGRPQDDQRTSSGPHKLSKDKLSKDNIILPPPHNTLYKESKEEVAAAEKEIVLAAARAIYENNIAPVCSAIEMEKIADDVERHGLQHWKEAVEIAVSNNARKLAYIEAILHRWEVNGYDGAGCGGDSKAGTRQSARREDRTDWSRVKDGWRPIEQKPADT